MSSIKIKDRTELDKLVAAAIGMAWYGSRTIMEAWWHKDGNRCRRTLPNFSIDLNDAFMAAEEVGLFDRYALTYLQGEWRITPAVAGLWFADPVIAQATTPALAICAAILKKEAG